MNKIYVITPVFDWELSSELYEFETKNDALDFIESSLADSRNNFGCTFDEYTVIEGKMLKLEEKKVVTKIKFEGEN